MLDTICSWYEAWVLGVMHWYVNHPVILATSLAASAVISLALAAIGIYFGVRMLKD